MTGLWVRLLRDSGLRRFGRKATRWFWSIPIRLILTDPQFAERTYIEPITPEAVERIIIKEKPDALLPTLGGQTALNVSMDLFHSGTLKSRVRMIGNADAIDSENRQRFKDAIKIGSTGFWSGPSMEGATR